MNRTQKIALLCIVIMLLSLAVLAYMVIQIAVLKKLPEGYVGRFGPLIILFAAMFLFLVWICKRQSPREVNEDERDKLIENRAAMAALVSVLIVLPAVSVMPRLILGEDVCIPAWSLPLINFVALPIIMIVYSTAILIQFGRRCKDGNK